MAHFVVGIRRSQVGFGSAPVQTGPDRIESALRGKTDEDRRKFGFRQRWSASGGIADVVGGYGEQPEVAITGPLLRSVATLSDSGDPAISQLLPGHFLDVPE